MTISNNTEDNIKYALISSPADSQTTWQIESFFLKIFEYTDYSIRSALTSKLSQSLQAVYFIARHHNQIIAAAGALYNKKSRFFVFVGPIAVDPQYRRQGIAKTLMTLLLDHLKSNNCHAAYLGVSLKNPARYLYQQLGFENYRSLVMRKLFVPESKITDHFNSPSLLNIEELNWHHLPALMPLLVYPAKLYTADFQRNIFSSRYFPPQQFTPLFKNIITDIQKNLGRANVLITKDKNIIPAFAHITPYNNSSRKHIAFCDFFLHDNYLNKAKILLKKTIQQVKDSPIEKIYFHCLACDHQKQQIIESIPAALQTIHPQNIIVNKSYVDLLVYSLSIK